MNKIETINRLKKEKNAVILAHYYVPQEIQEVADYIGDSYYLSKIATQVKQNTIVFCGVNFMGESAKTLNPHKTVLMPDLAADCPMAHMANLDEIKRVKDTTEDCAVVCYINSTNEIKALADVIVTSSNAIKIVKSLNEKNIYFIPDQNLGKFVASFIPEKNFIYNEGHCPIHDNIQVKDVLVTKLKYPNALVCAHPECTPVVLSHADYIGSTSGIIEFAQTSTAQEFIILTETGILHKLNKACKNKKFYTANAYQECKDMKLNTLDKLITVLENKTSEVKLDESIRLKALHSLDRMLELAE